MTQRMERAGLQVAPVLADFIETRALPDTGVTPAQFWQALADLVAEFSDENQALLDHREELQSRIDDWHLHHRAQGHDATAYKAFLKDIGYIAPEVEDFTITTPPLDPEISSLCGPQLVVPVTDARITLNAVNARWGSLYDAFYGTDALGDAPVLEAPVSSVPPAAGGLDHDRAARVVARAKAFLDQHVPLVAGSWAQACGVRVLYGGLFVDTSEETGLADPAQFLGYQGPADAPSAVVLKHNGLHIVLRIDADTDAGARDPAGICDVILEAALTTIIDFEDSVACVDADDKTAAYANWLGLMRGDLTAELTKNGTRMVRRLARDMVFTAPEGENDLCLKGRALMLVRTVGHLMRTPAVLDGAGMPVFEGLLDAMVCVVCALHDLQKPHAPRNSDTGAIYLVKPKMHGPAEVAFAARVMAFVEDRIGLAPLTIKMGIMDEERRTSVNLKACIAAAKDRVAFINTGFLDRTGDEISTAMEAGPVCPKGEMKFQPWISAYEDRNVDIGLACGMGGRAQIGKGMWAVPERMADMLAQKRAHPQSGASCSWVPSPTAATLHAMHYHQVDVSARQRDLMARPRAGRLDDLLCLPLATARSFTPDEVSRELRHNCHSILGYVVRWVDHGIGCSKVPDVENVSLMEDRATCRISAQSVANWLHHGVTNEQQVMDILREMAAVVDAQNAQMPGYRPMAQGYGGLAFQAACDLVFQGRIQPCGYTEPVLHHRRTQAKAEV
ncbi:malate synthase G [Rhodobacteraceae bacterium]|nr:malate synthase G [Paracoccaceae bacterium]